MLLNRRGGPGVVRAQYVFVLELAANLPRLLNALLNGLPLGDHGVKILLHRNNLIPNLKYYFS